MIRSREARNRATQIFKLAKIEKIPVNVHEVAKFLGFEVIPFEFPDHISAVTYIEDGVKSIGVNKNHANVRQRFSIAHEIGHFLCGHESYNHEATHIEDLPKYLDPQNRQELEADEFAAELLMPGSFLSKDAKRERVDAATWCKRYEVSEQAMWIQLMNLKLVPTKRLTPGSPLSP